MENKEIRLINLRQLLKEVRSASALAQAADTSPAYISQILSDKTKGNIGSRLARKLESATNKPKGWLDQLHNAHIEGALSLTYIPLLKSEEILAADCPKTYIQDELISSASPNHKNLFCIEMAGDSMVSITDIAASICHGDLAVVDKTQNYSYGDIILFKRNNALKVRKFIRDGDEQVLKAFNPQYSVIPFTADIHVLGVVIELRRKIKSLSPTRIAEMA
jgi:SOS-response transcriptional repressor LexA